MVVRGTKAQFSGTTINTKLDVYCDEIVLNGGIFNESCIFTTTGMDNSIGDGGCVFNDAVTIIHHSTSNHKFVVSNTSGNIYNNTVTLTNMGSGSIYMESLDSTMFNGNVKLNSSGSGNISITNAELSTGKTISVGDSGFSTGNFFLSFFLQHGATAQTITFTDSSSFLLRACEFNGNCNFTAPNIICGQSVFNGTAHIIKSATGGNYWNGNNTFNAATTITYEGTGGAAGDELRLANVLPNTYNGNVTFESVGNPIQVVCNSSSSFYGNINTNHREITFRRGETVFKGGNAQEISGTSNFDFEEVLIDKTDNEVTLNTPADIYGAITFHTGYFISDSVNIISFQPNSKAIGASNNSFVSGPVKKVGDTEFEFPVGKLNQFRPIAISAPSDVADAFIAEYHVDSVMVNTGDRDSTLGSVIRNKYWDLFRYNGGSEIYVTLSWNLSNRLSDTLITVAEWTGSLWKNLRKNYLTGDSLSGTILSNLQAEYYFQYALGYERNAAIYTTNNCFGITDPLQLQTCLNHAGQGDLLQITSDIILPDATTPGAIMYPLIINKGVTLQGYNGIKSPHWWEPACPLIASNYKAQYFASTKQELFLFGMEPGAIFQNLRLRGGNCHYQDHNLDNFFCGGIYIFTDNTADVATINYSEVSCFNYSGVFKGDGAGNFNIENCYIHKVKGKGESPGIGYGVWTMGHPNNLSTLNFTNSIFDDCKAAIDGQGDIIDWYINNCTFSQFFFSEDINKHNDGRFRMYHLNPTGNPVYDYHICYNNVNCSTNCFYGMFSLANPPCSSATSISYTYLEDWQSCGIGITFPIYDVGGANTTIENCIFHKKWKSNQNGNISLNFPNRDVSKGGNVNNGIYINNNTFATEELSTDEAINLNNNTGYARIADNYIEACVWSSDNEITKNGNSFNYQPGSTVTGAAPQPFHFSMQLFNAAGTDPLETSFTNSATSGHRFMHSIDVNEDFKISLENTIDATPLTYIIRPNPNIGSGIDLEIISNENYFHEDEIITANTSVLLQAYDKPGLYGIDVLAFDANDQDPGSPELYNFKASSWQHIPLIVKDDSENQVLYFNIKDSYLEANQQSSTGVMKQAYLNNQLLWEEDIADGGDGWEYVRKPLSSYLSMLNTDGTPNIISFRIFIGTTSVDANLVQGVNVWVDDVYIKKTGSPTGDNLIRDGSVELTRHEELPTGISLEKPWFRYQTDNFACSGTTNGAVFISSTDRKSGSQSLLLEMPDIPDNCSAYPNNVTVSVGTVIDFTELIGCADYASFGFVAFPCTTCTTQSLDDKYIISNNTIITGPVTITGSQIVMQSGITITVASGGHLIIENNGTENSHLFPCDEMWQGIIVEPGGQLTIDGNINNGSKRGTLVEGAILGIDCNGCRLECRYTEFNRNHQAINVQNNPNSNSYIYGNNFRCEDWMIGREPYLDQFPFEHVHIENITNFTFPVGQASIYTGTGKRNYFSEACFGMRVYNSNVLIHRNSFKNIYNKENAYRINNFGSAIFIHNDRNVSNISTTIGNEVEISSPGMDGRNYFNNVNAGIWLSNFANNGSIKIYNNNFDNSAYDKGSGTSFNNTAITLQSPRSIIQGTNYIYSNTITDCRLGIHALNQRGIRIGTDDNDDPFPNFISFHLGTAPNIVEHYSGIFLQACSKARITGGDDSGTPDIKNNQAVTATGIYNFRGIDIENSVNIRINCNVIKNIPRSVSLTGNCLGLLLRKNYFENYEIGVDNYSSVVGDQGFFNTSSDWEKLDNEWHGLGSYKVGGNINLPINWYYQNISSQYEPFPNQGNVNSIASSEGTPQCNDYLPQQRDILFGGIVGDSISFEEYDDEYLYITKASLFEELKSDTTTLTEGRMSDSGFQSFFNAADTSNIGLSYSVLEMANDTSLISDAYELNYAIDPQNSIEENSKTVNAIYLGKVLSGIELSIADNSTLAEISTLNWITGGNSIYMAASLLGLEIHPALESLRLSNSVLENPLTTEFSFPKTNVWLVPNPASNHITVYSNDSELFKIQLLDMNGSMVMNRIIGSNYSIDISALPNGIYRMNVANRSNIIKTFKVVIIK